MLIPSERRAFCDRLRDIRRERYGEEGGPALADALGIPTRTWENYEKGVTVPGSILLRFLCLLEVEPRWLLNGEGHRFRTGPWMAERDGTGVSAPGEVEPDPAGLRVLVVDDNVDFAEGIAILLRAAGHEVEVVHSGEDALKATAADRPDVVILDIGMPDMDGYEVARRFREEIGRDEMRVVGLSCFNPVEEGPLGKGSHFDQFFLKTVPFESLEMSLRI